jgi:aminoglycoside phosphotransferase (APT) family kinase protein
MLDLRLIALALGRAFPNLGEIEPLQFLGAGFDSVAVETAGGIVFRVARHATAGESYTKEAQVLPILQSYLPVALPEPKWYLPRSADFPFGVIGYRKLPGVPLAPDHVATWAQAKNVASQIARIILALHRVPLDTAPLRNDPERLRHAWLAQIEFALPALRSAVQPAEYEAIEQWWNDFRTDEKMFQYSPVMQHGDLWFGNLLVEGTQVVALIDFGNVGIGDPALDFVPQLYLGEAFLRRVMDAYQEAGGTLDADFDRRLRRLWAHREFGGVHYAIQHDDKEEFADAIIKLRKGPILHATGLDGWHRDWSNS